MEIEYIEFWIQSVWIKSLLSIIISLFPILRTCQKWITRAVIIAKEKRVRGKEWSKEAQEAALHPAVPRLLVAAETVIRSRCTVIYNAGL